MTIGEFGQLTRLSPKALRIYDRMGLLEPATVEHNGYRWYEEAQVRTGRLIALLRAAGLSLAEIGSVLDELRGSGERAAQRLERLLADKDRRHRSRRVLIRHVKATLREGEEPMFTIKTRRVPARRVMSIQRRLHAYQTDAFAGEARAVFGEHLRGSDPTGPFTLIFHGPVSDESDGPIEAVLGCPDHIQPTDVVGVRTEPAHDEAYTTLTKAQWEYPAILAAYDAVACSPEVKQRPGSGLSCREVYLAEPDEIDEHELICDVAWPLSDEARETAMEQKHLSVVERPEIPVMFKSCGDQQDAITRAWAELEHAVGSLRGRRFYGVFDPKSSEYWACAEVRDDDDPAVLGLERGTIAGGRYARLRLTGEPPAVYAEILPASKRLAEIPDADPEAPSVELYRRRDVIDLLQPLR